MSPTPKLVKIAIYGWTLVTCLLEFSCISYSIWISKWADFSGWRESRFSHSAWVSSIRAFLGGNMVGRKSDENGVSRKDESEMGSFVEDMAESLVEIDGSNEEEERDTRGYNIKKIYYVVFGAAALAAVILVVFSLAGRKSVPKDPGISAFLQRIQHLEESLLRLQGVEGRITSIEKEQKQVRQALGEAQQSGLLLKQQMEKMSDELKQVSEETSRQINAASQNKASEAEKRVSDEPSAAALKADVKAQPDDMQAKTSGTEKKKTGDVKSNGLYHVVKKGETLYRVSLKYGLSVEELCRINKITPVTVIVPGRKLLVKP